MGQLRGQSGAWGLCSPPELVFLVTVPFHLLGKGWGSGIGDSGQHPPGLTHVLPDLFLPPQALYSSIKNEKLQWAM